MPTAPDLPAPPPASAVTAHAAEKSPAHGPLHIHCENCGAALQGPFCHRCGQHDFEFHRSFGHVFLEALENFLHFDAKFFRNLITLLFSPGRLTADFNAGRRASQMPPFRLYLFVTFFFFLASTSLTTPPDLIHLTPQESAKIQADIDRAKAPDMPRTNNGPGRMNPGPQENPGGNAFERLLTKIGRHAFEHQAEVRHQFIAAMPKMLLFCLPFFALLTRFIFRKSGQAYLQHLVLAVHFHTFIYLWMMAASGWTGLASVVHLHRVVELACNLWVFAYPFLMFRRLFANSWPWTIFKTAAMAVAYLVVIVLGFAVTGIITILMV